MPAMLILAVALMLAPIGALAAEPDAVRPSALYKDTTVGQSAIGPISANVGAGDTTTAVVVASPLHGNATMDPKVPGIWRYTPESSFTGYDEFLLKTSDGHVTRVVVMVRPVPTRKTYYVDANHGSDKNPGTLAKPFASIQAAEEITGPGDTVFIRNGTYAETSGEAVLQISRSGLPGAIITYKAYPGEHPALHTAVAWNTVLVFASYIRIEGLEIEGNAKNVSIKDAAKVADRFMKGAQFESYGPETSAFETNGVFIRPVNQKAPTDKMIVPRHVQVIGNYVHDCQGGGITASWSDYVTIEGNRIDRNAVRAMYAASGISLLGLQNTDFDQPPTRM